MQSTSIQGWLNPMPHCPPPLQPWLQLATLESLKVKIKTNRTTTLMERRFYLFASRWAKVSKKKEESARLEGGSRRGLRNQWKYVQLCQRSQRVEDAGRQLCQVVRIEISASNKKCNRSNVQGWLNLMPRCTPPLELWLQLPALENLAAKLNKKKMRNPSMERRLYLAASRWARAKKQENIRFEDKGARGSKW